MTIDKIYKLAEMLDQYDPERVHFILFPTYYINQYGVVTEGIEVSPLYNSSYIEDDFKQYLRMYRDINEINVYDIHFKLKIMPNGLHFYHMTSEGKSIKCRITFDKRG